MNTLQNINSVVIEEIKSSNPRVVEAVKNRLVTKELERRTDALVKAIQEATTAEKELVKIKPDVVTYNEDGSVNSALWSKAKKEEKEKAVKKLGKIRGAIEKALEQGDYSQLLNPEQNNDKPDESKPA